MREESRGTRHSASAIPGSDRRRSRFSLHIHARIGLTARAESDYHCSALVASRSRATARLASIQHAPRGMIGR